ncbi:hypothetical protein [Moheibacter sp.]|uniref:hypothetical protein n=1 Tax=Moheibacter sp. TaxID=1965316 RepID=UPI003C710D54
MKSILSTVFLLATVLCLAQAFSQFETTEEPSQNIEFFAQHHYEADQATYALGGPGGPGDPPLPIDDWLALLPLCGALIGVYFIQKRKKNLA